MQTLIERTESLVHIPLTDSQQKKFQLYEDLLIEWNEKINLTAIRDVEGIRTKHFLDSLSCELAMRNTAVDRVIDVGTGAGFPGIPLKIIHPEMQLTLVESTGKKARFCQLVTDALQLDQVKVETTRAEELAHLPAHREKYDWAIARAVASLPALVEYLLPLVRVGGYMLAQKGISAHAEVQAATNAIKVLGGELVNIHLVELPGVADERYLVVIRKAHISPQPYPRQSGLPVKKPIL